MKRLIALAMLALAAAAPTAMAEDLTVTINETKIDSLINSMNQLTSALTSSNVAVSGVGGAAGGATQIGAGANTATGAQAFTASDLARGATKGSVSAQYGAVGVNEDVGTTETTATVNANSAAVVNAMLAQMVQLANAETQMRLRQAEQINGQTLRHQDLAAYHQWGLKPPVAGVAFDTATANPGGN